MRYLRWLVFTVVLILSGTRIIAGQNQIQIENALTGTMDWQIPNEYNVAPAGVDHQVEGYASETSVNIGETIRFHLRVADGDSPLYFDIYRLGYYNGAGARLVYSSEAITVANQYYPVPDSSTGLAECDWPSPENANWTVPSYAVSGVYLVKLTSGGYSSYISFVVRDDARTSGVLFQRSVTTDQAYNNYPGALYVDGDGKPTDDYRNGKSLYEFNSGGTLLPGSKLNHQARKVSFNRPYGVLSNPGIGYGIYDTAGGSLFGYDYQMIRWLERNGYDVTYCTDVDTHTADSTNGRFSAGRHKAFLSVGHDEYWSWEMRDNVEQARDRTQQPLNLGFFGANTCYWQIRFEESSASSHPAQAANRTIVGYKELAKDSDLNARDPYYSDDIAGNNHLITNLWRKNQENQDETISKPPEDELVGVMSNLPDDLINPILCCGSNPAIISGNAPEWITYGSVERQFNGLVGNEADRHFPENYSGRNLTIVATSPFYNDQQVYRGDSNMTYYSFDSSGAHVFATGTEQWQWGLDDFNADGSVGPIRRPSYLEPDVSTITTNIMGCLLDLYTRCGTVEPPADLAVWRPGTNSVWYVMGPGNTIQASASWGTSSDVPAPGDYDGDGKTDFCVFRPNNHTWYFIYSSNDVMVGVDFGASGDLIAQADYDGDGKTDIAVFHPSTGDFNILGSDSGFTGVHFGTSGDHPASADYDGDGRADVTVWRDSNHTFYSLRSSDDEVQSAVFGASGYEPIPSDYDGDGKADYALFQSASSAYFHIVPSTTNTLESTQFGGSHDQAVPNDYDGDGKCDIAVWRFENSSGANDNGNWYIRQSGMANSFRADHWGMTGDVPVPAFYRR